MIDESSNVKGNTCVCSEFRRGLSRTQKTNKKKGKNKKTQGNLATKLAARLIYEEPVVLVEGGGWGGANMLRRSNLCD